MDGPTRRGLLQASGTVALGAFAGCLTVADRGDSPTPDTPGGTPAEAALTGWERSTGCGGMHDSVVSVKRVESSLDETYSPIHFSALTAAEQEILRAVTTEGGYGTCDVSDAFQQIVERVSEHRHRQNGDMHVYLEREGFFYGLYVEKQDQVYAY